MVEAKPVEQIFLRLTEVWNFHVDGKVIRTTGEHPFYAYEKGWTAVKDLTVEDWVLTDSGDWKRVEEAWNTGELEAVYNLLAFGLVCGLVELTFRTHMHSVKLQSNFA